MSYTSYAGLTEEDKKLFSSIQANKDVRNNSASTQDNKATQALQIQPRQVEGGQGGNKSRYSSGVNQKPDIPDANTNPPPKTEVPGKGDTWKFDPAGKMKSNWAAKSPEQKAAGAMTAAANVLNTLDMLTGGKDKIQWMSNDLSIGSNWSPQELDPMMFS